MPNIIFTCGLPGSGKTWYANQIKEFKGDKAVVLSSDDIRAELWGDANDQQNPNKVFATMKERAVRALKEGKDVIYDATNLVSKTRKTTLAEIQSQVECSATLVFCACSISECKRRQGDRDRKVPDEVIDRMVRQFEAPWYNEGWNNIFVISTGKTQDIAREHRRMTGESHDNPHHTASLEGHCINCEMEMRRLLTKHNYNNPRLEDILLEAAYQHDIGKHKTKRFLDTKGNPTDIAHYYNHNNVGAYLWLTSNLTTAFGQKEFLFIAQLIQWHMQPYFLLDDEGDYHTRLREWCDKRGYDDLMYDSLCLLHEADRKAH